MNSTEIILSFLTFLSDVTSMFRKVALEAEGDPALYDVSTNVIPASGFGSDFGEYAAHDVIISIALNAELRKPIDADKKAIGMSLLLRHAGGCWIAEAEVGWSGQNIGWDNFDEREAREATIEEIMIVAPPLVEWMGARFREEVATLPK